MNGNLGKQISLHLSLKFSYDKTGGAPPEFIIQEVPNMPLLELEHVSYSYHSKNGETYAISDISFQVEKGEFIAVTGPSGCGKSTL